MSNENQHVLGKENSWWGRDSELLESLPRAMGSSTAFPLCAETTGQVAGRVSNNSIIITRQACFQAFHMNWLTELSQLYEYYYYHPSPEVKDTHIPTKIGTGSRIRNLQFECTAQVLNHVKLLSAALVCLQLWYL